MSIRKAFAWSFMGQILSFLSTFGTTVVLARILSPRDIGIYAAGLAILGMVQAISAFGVGSYVVRERDLTPTTVAAAFTINSILSVLLAAIVFAASYFPAVTAGEPMVGQVLRLLAIVPILGAFEFRPAVMLQREMNFRLIALVTVVRTIASAIVSIGAAFAGARALSAAYGGLAYSIVGVVGFLLAAPRHSSLMLSLDGWRSMVRFGFQTLAIGGVSTMSMRASDFLLGRLLGFSALGYYSRASALSNTIFQNLYGSTAKVLFAKLAEDDRADFGIEQSYLNGLRMILALMWPVLGGIAVLAAPVVEILFGSRWYPAALPLALLMVAQAIALSFALNHELFVLRNQLGKQSKLETVRSVVGLLVFVVGCTFGLAGAAAARIVDSIIGVVLYVPRLTQLVKTQNRALLSVYVQSLALAAAAVAPSSILMITNDWRADVDRLSIFVSVLAGAALWVLLLRLTKHPLYNEIVRVIDRAGLPIRRRPFPTPPS